MNYSHKVPFISQFPCRTVHIGLCTEEMGDREGALAPAREAHRVYTKLGASHAIQERQSAELIHRLGAPVRDAA
jgi:hypothetical protein